MFALSISGDLRLLLAHQIEELLPGILERKEKYCTMALAHYAEGGTMAFKTAECFKVAALLEESATVEPFK